MQAGVRAGGQSGGRSPKHTSRARRLHLAGAQHAQTCHARCTRGAADRRQALEFGESPAASSRRCHRALDRLTRSSGGKPPRTARQAAESRSTGARPSRSRGSGASAANRPAGAAACVRRRCRSPGCAPPQKSQARGCRSAQRLRWRLICLASRRVEGAGPRPLPAGGACDGAGRLGPRSRAADQPRPSRRGRSRRRPARGGLGRLAQPRAPPRSVGSRPRPAGVTETNAAVRLTIAPATAHHQHLRQRTDHVAMAPPPNSGPNGEICHRHGELEDPRVPIRQAVGRRPRCSSPATFAAEMRR